MQIFDTMRLTRADWYTANPLALFTEEQLAQLASQAGMTLEEQIMAMIHRQWLTIDNKAAKVWRLQLFNHLTTIQPPIESVQVQPSNR